MGQGRLAQVERAVDIDGEHPLPGFRGFILHRLEATEARDVAENIEAAPCRDRLIHQIAALGGIADVGGDSERHAAGVGDCPGRRLGTRAIDVGAEHARALAAHAQRRGLSHARCRSRDQGDLAAETCCHHFCLHAHRYLPHGATMTLQSALAPRRLSNFRGSSSSPTVLVIMARGRWSPAAITSAVYWKSCLS